MNPKRIFNPCAGSSNALCGCWGSCWTLQRHTPHGGNTRSTAGRTVTLYEFNALDMDARASHLWAHGEYVTGIADAQGRSNFYALPGYFVEVELFDEGDAIAAVIPFSTGDRYERMIRGVDLSRLT